MRILILGGDGFCGWPTSLHLSARGHDVGDRRQLRAPQRRRRARGRVADADPPAGRRGCAAWQRAHRPRDRLPRPRRRAGLRRAARRCSTTAARRDRALRRAARRAVLDEDARATSATRSTTTSTRRTTCWPRWSRPSSTPTSSTSARWASTATAPAGVTIPEGYLRVRMDGRRRRRGRAGDPLPGQPGQRLPHDEDARTSCCSRSTTRTTSSGSPTCTRASCGARRPTRRASTSG